MSLSATNVSALSRIFSSTVFRQLGEKGRSPLFARLIHDAGLLQQTESTFNTVGEAFDAGFSFLRRAGHRDEYVYKSALTHNILLGRHSLKTASLLTEFRAGKSKADVAILNGSSTVYEIKSERDSLARLENQLRDYRKVFAKIYVVAGESFVEQILSSTSADIGVMSLARWDRIQTVREATERPESVCPATIFESLRSSEARDILRSLGIDIPEVPNTQLHAAMRARFASLTPLEVHREMVHTLKRTRNLATLGTLIHQLPSSLKPAALSTRLRRTDHAKLIAAVHTPINQAMNWA